jgi:isocitrate dehydrogenase
LTWVPSSSPDADGYVIYRKAGSDPYEKLDLVSGRTTTAYVDETVRQGITYVYELRTTSGSHFGPLSQSGTARTSYFCT